MCWCPLKVAECHGVHIVFSHGSIAVQLHSDVLWRAGIIDEEKKVKHTKFGQKIEEIVTDPSKINVKLKADMVDISYPPIVQSGGVYDLRAGAANDDRPLQYDVVLMAIGAARSLFSRSLYDCST